MRPSTLIPSDAPVRVKAPTLAKWFGVTPRAIWLWVERGLLPQPIRLAPKTLWFDTKTVRAHLARRELAAARKVREV